MTRKNLEELPDVIWRNLKQLYFCMRRIILITYVLRGSQSRNPGDDNVENKYGQTQTTQKIKNTQNDCHGPFFCILQCFKARIKNSKNVIIPSDDPTFIFKNSISIYCLIIAGEHLAIQA